MEQLNWLAKANVQARHSVGKAHLTCLHLPVTVPESINGVQMDRDFAACYLVKVAEVLLLQDLAAWHVSCISA